MSDSTARDAQITPPASHGAGVRLLALVLTGALRLREHAAEPDRPR